MPRPDTDDHDRRDLVALVLAIGISLAVIMLMAAVLYDALRSDTPGLSENATQVITNISTGIIGVLGGYIGGRQVQRAANRQRLADDAAAVDQVSSPDDGA
jgi:hypothetical protein